jgi:GntR family transcriptional regulator
MDEEWSDSQPIYRQLRDRVVAMILEGVLREGDPVPSVRTVAADYRVNPLTVLKAYQQLADEQILEKRRGVGLFVQAGARQGLLRDQRSRFLSEEWPRVLATIQRLGLQAAELLDGAARRPGPQEPGPASAPARSKGRR